MTVADAWPIQTWVYGVVSAAAQGLPVYDHIPDPRPPEHIRIDAMNVRPWNFRTGTGEAADHTWMIHYFGLSGAEGTVGLGTKRGHDILAPIHAAMMAARYNGHAPQSVLYEIEVDDDALSVHGMLRYRMSA